jgi:arabinofuranan 3-O-arabinosyltransferase
MDRSAAPDTRFKLALILLLSIAAVAACPPLLIRLLELGHDLAQPGIGQHSANSDFIKYWMAARLFHSGDLDTLFDYGRYMALLQGMFGADYPYHAWSYPPHAILLLLPLSSLAYEPAMLAFFAATLLLYGWAAAAFRRAFAPDCDIALYVAGHLAFVFLNFAAAQNGFLTAALLLGFLSASGRQPILSGIFLALLTIKPQLGLLIPLLLLMERRWSEIFWACVFSLAFIGLSVVLLGVQPWSDFFAKVLPDQKEIMSSGHGIMMYMMPTLMISLRVLGMSDDTAFGFQLAFSIACLPLAFLALRRAECGVGKALALTISTALIAPYSFNYDMGAMVTAASAGLASSRMSMGKVWYAALCLLPVFMMPLGMAGFPLAPIVLVIALVCLGIVRPSRVVAARSSDAAGAAA